MTMKSKASLLILLLLTSFIPFASAEDPLDIPEIFVDWTDEHAYIITGNVDIANITVTHIQNGAERNITMNYDTTGDSLRLILDSSLM